MEPLGGFSEAISEAAGRLIGRRFWALAADEDEELGGNYVADDHDGEDRFRSFMKICKTPTPSSSRSSGSSSSRASQRLRKINAQRYASKSLSLFSDNDVRSLSVVAKRKTNFRVLKRPVLEPTVFVEEQDRGGWTVVGGRRRSSPPAKSRCWFRSPFRNSKYQKSSVKRGSNGSTLDRMLGGFGPVRPDVHESPSVGKGFGSRSAPRVCTLKTLGLGLCRFLGFT